MSTLKRQSPQKVARMQLRIRLLSKPAAISTPNSDVAAVERQHELPAGRCSRVVVVASVWMRGCHRDCEQRCHSALCCFLGVSRRARTSPDVGALLEAASFLAALQKRQMKRRSPAPVPQSARLFLCTFYYNFLPNKGSSFACIIFYYCMILAASRLQIGAIARTALADEVPGMARASLRRRCCYDRTCTIRSQDDPRGGGNRLQSSEAEACTQVIVNAKVLDLTRLSLRSPFSTLDSRLSNSIVL